MAPGVPPLFSRRAAPWRTARVSIRRSIWFTNQASGLASRCTEQTGGRLDESRLSDPDGRWLAYISQESGRYEVYVEPFRRRGERVRASANGGGQPKWRGDGKELFYVAPDGRLMAVAVKASTDRLDVALPVPLFARVIPDPVRDMFAPSRDGQRFLVVVPTGSDTGTRIHVVTNWTSLLR